MRELKLALLVNMLKLIKTQFHKIKSGVIPDFSIKAALSFIYPLTKFCLVLAVQGQGKMKFGFIFVVLHVCFVPLVYAASPGSLDLKYDADSGQLIVSGQHPTQDRFEHFIRRVVVSVNSGDPQTFYFHRQDSPASFKQTIAMSLNDADLIRVDVFCSYGGSLSSELVIESEKVEPEPQSSPLIDIKQKRMEEHKNLQIIP